MQKVTDTKTIGLLIRGNRKAQKLTQESLSALCGVGVRFVREVEQGKEGCHIGKVLLVMQALGLDLAIVKRGELWP